MNNSTALSCAPYSWKELAVSESIQADKCALFETKRRDVHKDVHPLLYHILSYVEDIDHYDEDNICRRHVLQLRRVNQLFCQLIDSCNNHLLAVHSMRDHFTTYFKHMKIGEIQEGKISSLSIIFSIESVSHRLVPQINVYNTGVFNGPHEGRKALFVSNSLAPMAGNSKIAAYVGFQFDTSMLSYRHAESHSLISSIDYSRHIIYVRAYTASSRIRLLAQVLRRALIYGETLPHIATRFPVKRSVSMEILH